MDADSPATNHAAIVTAADDGRPTPADRVLAAVEVVLCSDYPTQLLVAWMLAVLGFRPANGDGTLNLPFVVWLSLLDTVLLIGLIVMFLRARGERPRDVFLGAKPVLGEVRHGVPMILTAFLIAVVVLVSVRWLMPSLHSVPENPLRDLVRTPLSAALFAIVVVVAGGVREELQRAFLMHRFERWLGGPVVGVVVASVAFGLGHGLQGYDATIATGLLGAYWAVVYLRRRSVVAPVVSHSGFNLLQLAQLLVIGQ